MRIGVDEAGKGPVLGSMFAAAVRADPAKLPVDVDDSKQLDPATRDRLAIKIRDRAEAVEVVEISVARIDEPETDMNSLTVEAHANALRGVAAAEIVAYLDAGDTDAERFGTRVSSALETDISVRPEHGADESYPIVGAASIVAKVARDEHVARLASEYGEIGSGYPSDPTTREFLAAHVASHGELPACARESWQTSRDVLAAAEQSGLADF